MADETSDCLKYPEWQKALQEALLEFDPHQLKERITSAETAIADRQRQLSGGLTDEAERQAIQDGSRLLHFLKERLARIA